MPTRREFLLSLLATAVQGSLAWAQARTCGPPPPAKPQQRAGGESFPPLPLPATPIRRTERKRPPAPPALVGKVALGPVKWTTDNKGQRTSYRDWMTDPADMVNLLDWSNNQLGLQYRSVEVELEKFSFDPTEIPILYATGHDSFRLTDEVRAKLAQYLLDGGYLIGDACCGTKAFADSFLAEMEAVFPHRPLFKLPPDHPLFRCFYPVGNVNFQVQGKDPYSAFPEFLGANIGCRLAVFFSPVDLSCGWDGHIHPTGARILPDGARPLGANLITYDLANYQLGRFLSTQKQYFQRGERTRDEFVFGQVVHDGDWDPDPGAVANLLRAVTTNSTMEVQFTREDVDLRTVDTFRHHFLYCTGHRNFVLTDVEVKALRGFLLGGGVLLADACCGQMSFDTAFRRELARAIPEAALGAIDLTHPLFSALFRVTSTRATDYLRARGTELAAPQLEGLSLGGNLVVIYSRYDLGCGWEGMEHPYGEGYQSEGALALAANTLIYGMTH
jgi:hypothetical protein